MSPNSLKTFSHLEAGQRLPSDYEVASTNLLYYQTQGFEVETPVSEWFKKYQLGSPLQCSDWSLYNDPSAFTYTQYTTHQSTSEAFIRKLFESMESAQDIRPAWREETLKVAGALRYVCHGLHMTAAYIGHMAPASKVTISCAFQAADEMRRVQHFSYLLAALDGARSGEDAKKIWLEAMAWQPLRKMIEELLITYDWGEAFAALNLAVKPQVDILLERFSEFSKESGRYEVHQIISTLLEDSTRNQNWALALQDVLIKNRAENEPLLKKWRTVWRAKAEQAIKAVTEQWTQQ